MDIQLKKKAWYIRYRYSLIGGILFLAFVVYLIVLVVRPTRMQILAEDYKIATVLDTCFMEYLDVEGLVQPISTIQVNTSESGTVARIVAEEGAMLCKGDTILVLENAELLRTIEDEQSEWIRKQHGYREQEIEMEQKTIALEQEALEARYEMQSLDRKLALSREEFRMGIKSRAELDVAEEEYAFHKQKSELQMKRLNHDSIATRLKRQMLQDDIQDADRRKIHSESRLHDLVVTAPQDGQLSYVGVTLGQRVAQGSAIGEIKVLSEYKVHTALSEYYIDRITTGLPASIQYQGERFPLRITRVVPEVKDRTFDTDLVFTANRPSNIRLGKSYTVQIELGRPEQAIIIPRGNFYQATGGTWIYRLSADGKSATRVPIELGRQNPGQYEILSGLTPGERVIVSGYDKLGDTEMLLIKE